MTTHDQLPPHSHDPNPAPPGDEPSLTLRWAGGKTILTPDELAEMPLVSIANCHIVSTGHPISGPFAFRGVSLLALLKRYVNITWETVDVISADGFWARLKADELRAETERPSLLALEIDGRPLSRALGLVRLIVPGETDDALHNAQTDDDFGHDFDFHLFDYKGEARDLMELPLNRLSVTVVDTETTGLNPDQGDEIIAIGAVRVVNGRILRQESFDSFVRPRRIISEQARAILDALACSTYTGGMIENV